jgi:hypothetical protein
MNLSNGSHHDSVMIYQPSQCLRRRLPPPFFTLGFMICRSKYFRRPPAYAFSFGKIFPDCFVYSLSASSDSKRVMSRFHSGTSTRSTRLTCVVLTAFYLNFITTEVVITYQVHEYYHTHTFRHSSRLSDMGIPNMPHNPCHEPRSFSSVP